MITEIDVELWLGSDVKKSELIEIITEIANGEYTVESLRKDVGYYNEEEPEEIDWGAELADIEKEK